MSWRDDLRPASWRGLPFQTLNYEIRFGRRVAIHEYPFRDPVWVEDLGRGMRRLHLIGYLVGDDVVQQQEAMIEAAETEGPGELVHPTLGLRQVTLIDFGTAARHETGRMVELAFTFVEGSERVYPGTGLATGAALLQAAAAAEQAASGDFLASVRNAAGGGLQAVQQAQSTLRVWTSTASRLVGEATNAINSVGALIPGYNARWSRYLTGARSPLARIAAANSTVRGRLTQLSRARAAVTQGASHLEELAGRIL